MNSNRRPDPSDPPKPERSGAAGPNPPIHQSTNPHVYTPSNEDLSADYPPHLKHLAPTHTEMDMVAEEMLGVPVDRGSAQLNIAALEKRVAMLTEQISALEGFRAEGANDCDGMINELRPQLDTARALLAGYKAQQSGRN